MQTRDEALTASSISLPRLSWGAILAGMFFVLAFGWLLSLLGGALGFSVADSTDMEAVGAGFGIAATVWVVLSLVIAFFLGGLVTARLSGDRDTTRGMLYGLSLWSVATILGLGLGWMGLQGALSMGASAVSGVASVGSGLIDQGGDAAQALMGAGSSMAQSDLAAGVRSDLEENIEKAISEADGEGRGGVTPQEVDRAPKGLDSQVLQKAVAQIVSGDVQEARATLRKATGLSRQEVDALIEGASDKVREGWNQSEIARAVEAEARAQLDALKVSIARAGGPGLTTTEVEEAFDQIDAAILGDMATDLIAGRPEAAKRTLRRETTLERADIDTLVASASTAVTRRVDEFQRDALAAAETASDYAEGALWALCVGAMLSLLACASGGAVGASSARDVELARIQTVHPVT